MTVLPLVRCDLECGHVAYSLPREARQIQHGWYFCHAHGRYVAIVKAEPLEPAGTRTTARLRRHVLRKT